MPRHNVRVITVKNRAYARDLLTKLGADPQGVEAMELKFCQYVLALSRVSLRGALIIKQEMLSLGGEAALPREAAALAAEQVDVLLSGTAKQLLGLAEKLARQPFGLKQVAKELQEAVEPLLAPRSGHWQCREYSLPLGQKTYIMGILNVTPDSFSDGGRYLEPEAAIRRARQMVDEGADIIDVGGESTRPGAEFVSEEDELARVIPVVSQLAKELAVPISVDTTKYRVAEASLEAGASIINDISGLQFEPRLADLAAKYRAGLVLMHTRGTPREMQKNPVYTDVVAEVLSFLQSAVDQALARGVSREQIILDPGIGFAKTCEHNLEILNRLAEFRTLGYPLLLGTSRKSFIGKVLDLPVDQRVEGTAASVALGIAAGADVVRVHDVREMARVAKVSDAIARYQRSGQDES